MRRPASRRIFVIALVLARLVLGDFLHLPAAQAAPHEARPMMMMGSQPCPGMDTAPTPTHGSTCCKSSQCPCLHAPALMITQQMPVVFSISYADLTAPLFHLIGEPPAVFFRPPI
jgi:hypothetical protein